MSFRIQDFKCTECKHVTEILLDSRDENQEIKCEKCGSDKLNKILSAGTGKGGHVSWSKWRAQQ